MHADLLVEHANLATLAGPDGPRAAEEAANVAMIHDGAVAMADGKIVWVGPTTDWDGEAARTLDASGRLVTPGFVDPHTHLIYAGDRAFELAAKLQGKSYLEILAAGGGIRHTTTETRKADVDALVAAARPRLERMMRNGTTALEAKTGYALETAGELRMLEAAKRLSKELDVPMAHTFLGAHAVAPEFAGDAARYVEHLIEDMLPAVAGQGIATYCDVFVETDVFTPEQGIQIFDAARKHGLIPRLHADEIDDLGGAALAAATRCVSADHLLAASDDGIAAMAEAGTTAVLLPTVPMTLMAPKWARGKAFLEAGVPVALASDHNPNNPVTDLGLVAQMGCYLLGLTPEQALTGLTWNAAACTGLDDRCGSLEVGKRADLLVHDVPDLAHWVHEPGRKTVHTVIRGATTA